MSSLNRKPMATDNNFKPKNPRKDRVSSIRDFMPANEMGKLPPQAVDLEEAVLGAMLLEGKSLNAVIDILKPDSFYKEANGDIFEAIRELFGAGQAVDILTVTQALRKAGKLDFVGGPLYISQKTKRELRPTIVDIQNRKRFALHYLGRRSIYRILLRKSFWRNKTASKETCPRHWFQQLHHCS